MRCFSCAVALTRSALQDASTGVLYGATSESVASSTFGNSYSAGSTFALGGTEATFMVTFQLPAIPPTGSLPLLRASFFSTSNSGGGGGMANPQSYNVYIRAMPASTMFMPGVTTGGSSTGGYVYAYVSSYYTDSSGTTTSVNPGQQMMGPPPFLLVPKLFGGSWVTVAVSVSSSNNVTVYTRDSVLSSSLSFGASDTACCKSTCMSADACVSRRLEPNCTSAKFPGRWKHNGTHRLCAG